MPSDNTPLDGMLTQAGDVYLRLHNHPGGTSRRGAAAIPPRLALFIYEITLDDS